MSTLGAGAARGRREGEAIISIGRIGSESAWSGGCATRAKGEGKRGWIVRVVEEGIRARKRARPAVLILEWVGILCLSPWDHATTEGAVGALEEALAAREPLGATQEATG